MTINHFPSFNSMIRRSTFPSHSRSTQGVAEMKARQAAKIRQLGEALAVAGFVTLGKQADALGLSRSTTWTILKGHHKGSGLSTAIIKRMLASPQLPPDARAVILEYIEQKTSGHYGDCRRRIRNFAAGLSITQANAGRERMYKVIGLNGRAAALSSMNQSATFWPLGAVCHLTAVGLVEGRL
jgi:hypothetical protein